ncbi:insulinase family protein [Promicromonospora soli]|uniref:Uncharacterized protein n=1 Tax=Promicromonospora soli TaxID=2035533 RepID=A0A919KLU0_9MICO|nr:insulinase family protein [Promicromonospora soli]GHH64760.1 hypothetical protein GCM10017772_01750 [Promicromonospora soli]
MTAPALPVLTDLPGITLAEADGVPLLLAPREGNTTGGIIFRVGSADETLATAGITHLIEHLALRTQVLSEAHLNGHTRSDVTLFHVAGSAADVVAYLNAVCESLRDLPLDLIETEKDILRSESDGRSPGFGGQLRINRHGARGHGLVGYGERGLDRITPDEVREWAARWFTRENAVAWITADAVPDGLDLRLPAGSRMPSPTVTNVLRGTPAYLAGLRDGVALDALVPHGKAGQLTAGVMREVLHGTLRRDADIASSVDVSYEALNPDQARIGVVVQAAEGRQGSVAGAVADALGRLWFYVADDDLAAARTAAVEELAGVAELPAADMLPSVAYRVLNGRPVEGAETIRAHVELVTADDVRAVARDLWGTALWYVPGALDWAGIVPVPQWSEQRARGREFRRIDAPDVSLVLAEDGVGLVAPQGAVTVRFADCVLLETVPDGARVLTGADGFRVLIEPTVYRDLTGEDVARHVDSRVAADVIVHHPPRDPERVPVAEPPRPPGAKRADRTSVSGTIERLVGLWVVGFLVLGGGQLAAEELLDLEIRLGVLPLLALGAASVALVRKRHGKGAR